MTTMHGTIWAQAVWWNSTWSSKTRRINFAQGRNISAYSSLSGYYLQRGSLGPIWGGGQNFPPWYCVGYTGIAWYRAGGQRHPNSGNFDPPLPYIQANDATEIEFRLAAGLVADGDCYIRAVHVINFFQ
jgi:hypothetical protein